MAVSPRPVRTRPIQTLLVANRGEIAVRVMRTCQARGVRSVAVYSDADRHALHVRTADEAHRVGPAASAESYLVQDRIIEAAKASGADAIHPGYGFLSENAGFAERCEQEGITFVGPTPHAIRLMGDKTEARKLMAEAGVPMAPGTTDAIDDLEEAEQIAAGIGYPVLIKAAAGGGGKGMRVVEEEAEFKRAMEAAQREAQNAFGDARVYIEKYLVGPRHIEIQVLADQHGNTVYLFERECSIQRRHQKVVEEAPSAALTPEIRRAMGETAVLAAEACGYVGAGTVEFLLDARGDFYFLEMNTRLQVEHPVTEEITGLDLVAEQLRIAEGEALGYTQADLEINGHAIECRVYAEDVPAGFLPNPGPLHRHRAPSGPGIRVDTGVTEGDEVPVYYDPMISKLTVWAPTREAAIDQMDQALADYEIAGVSTTIPFCRFVMQHDAFRSGAFDTGFVGTHFTPEMHRQATPEMAEAAALAAVLALERLAGGPSAPVAELQPQSPWALRRR